MAPGTGGMMRSAFMAIALAIFCPACMQKPAHSTAGAPIPKPNPEWLQCQSDADCSASFGPCGEWIAVNRKYIKQEQEWAVREGRALSCETNRNPVPNTACRSRVCAILP